MKFLYVLLSRFNFESYFTKLMYILGKISLYNDAYLVLCLTPFRIMILCLGRYLFAHEVLIINRLNINFLLDWKF